MVNAQVLVQLALRHPAMHIRTSGVLASTSVNDLKPEIRPLPAAQWTSSTSLTASSYASGTWVPLQAAREHFDEALGGPAGFDEWLVRALTISPAEAYKTHNTTVKVSHRGHVCSQGEESNDPADMGEIQEHIRIRACKFRVLAARAAGLRQSLSPASRQNLVHYLPVWRDYIRQFFLSSIEDGISYVEVRLNFLSRYARRHVLMPPPGLKGLNCVQIHV